MCTCLILFCTCCIPKELGGLTRLSTLVVSNNQLTGKGGFHADMFFFNTSLAQDRAGHVVENVKSSPGFCTILLGVLVESTTASPALPKASGASRKGLEQKLS
ncbi:unnamed protein product [Ectocarpus sp. 12 AP-2014]